MEIEELRTRVEKGAKECGQLRSAWGRGVFEYAEELLDNLAEYMEYYELEEVPSYDKIQAVLLNGAESWSGYSWGGCSLIYNNDIAQRLCSLSELKRTANGMKAPNAREDWLDVQARALYQSYMLIRAYAPISEA